MAVSKDTQDKPAATDERDEGAPLTDEDLANVAGGVGRLQRMAAPGAAGTEQCESTEDSGAMGCPG